MNHTHTHTLFCIFKSELQCIFHVLALSSMAAVARPGQARVKTGSWSFLLVCHVDARAPVSRPSSALQLESKRELGPRWSSQVSRQCPHGMPALQNRLLTASHPKIAVSQAFVFQRLVMFQSVLQVPKRQSVQPPVSGWRVEVRWRNLL